MATFERHVDVDWHGSVMEGRGEAKAGTGAFSLPVTFPSRIGDANGKTSPEELIAAAHAACFAMALSNTLNKGGTPPDQLNVNAVCTLDRVEGGVKITQMALTVRGKVPGLDGAGFERAVREAEQGCPVSNALRNNVQMQVSAQLGA